MAKIIKEGHKPKGQPAAVKTPEALLALWNEYKQYVDDNPHKDETVSAGKLIVVTSVAPYLRSGFEAYVYRVKGHHVHQYIDNYKNVYDRYVGIVTHMRSEWRTDQMSGALTGRYKASTLIARMHGLVDKKDVTTDGKSIENKSIPIILPDGKTLDDYTDKD